MSRWHANIGSHPGHYLVDSYTWPWSPNDHDHGQEWPLLPPPLFNVNPPPPILRYGYFKIWPSKSLVKAMRVVKSHGHIWPWKFKDQGYCQVQTHWSHLRPGVQSICLLFISWQSDHFGLRYSKLKSCSKVIVWKKVCGRQWRRRNKYKYIITLVYRVT